MTEKTKIEIVYNPDEDNNYSLKIKTESGSVKFPVKGSLKPDEILEKIGEILDLSQIEITAIPEIKEIHHYDKFPYEWDKQIIPTKPQPYITPEIWCGTNSNGYNNYKINPDENDN